MTNSTYLPQDDDMSSLEDLLGESQGLVEEASQHDADLKARKRGFVGMSKEEVDFCNSRMQVFEQAKTWKPRENIAVLTCFKCKNCASEQTVFTRWMQSQVSRANPSNRRFDTVLAQVEGLPTITALETRETAACFDCAAGDFGVDMETAYHLEDILK